MTQTEAIALLSGVHQTLTAQSDLSPRNTQVNSCLRRFIITLQAWQAANFGYDLPDDPDLAYLADDLPRLCGQAECEMEKWWARRILESHCPGAQALAAFWYLDNYEALCKTELDLLGETRNGHFVFLGSGALPLTAILLARHCPDTQVTCVDCDAHACELAERLMSLLGLSERITVQNCNALAYDGRSDDTVICASLLDAQGLFDHLYDRRIQKIILRDSEGPYRFCYRPARLPSQGYSERAKSSISPAHINTSRYFEAIIQNAD